MDQEIRELVRVLIERQIRTDKSVNELAVTVSRHVDAANDENLGEHDNGKPQ